MRDHTRIRAAGVLMMLAMSAMLMGCSGGQENVSLEMRFVEDAPGEGLSRMAMTVWGGEETYYVHPEVLLDETDVAVATVTRLDDGVPAMELELTDMARLELLSITQQNVGRYVGVLVGGKLQCVMRVNAPNGTGRILVTGHMLEGAARRCSEALTRNALERGKHDESRSPSPDRRDDPPA